MQAAARSSDGAQDAMSLDSTLVVPRRRTYYLPERLFAEALARFSELQTAEADAQGEAIRGAASALRWHPADGSGSDDGARARAQQEIFDTALRACKVPYILRHVSHSCIMQTVTLLRALSYMCRVVHACAYTLIPARVVFCSNNSM